MFIVVLFSWFFALSFWYLIVLGTRWVANFGLFAVVCMIVVCVVVIVTILLSGFLVLCVVLKL